MRLSPIFTQAQNMPLNLNDNFWRMVGRADGCIRTQGKEMAGTA
jgi:hypothetical protein